MVSSHQREHWLVAEKVLKVNRGIRHIEVVAAAKPARRLLSTSRKVLQIRSVRPQAIETGWRKANCPRGGSGGRQLTVIYSLQAHLMQPVQARPPSNESIMASPVQQAIELLPCRLLAASAPHATGASTATKQ